MLIINITDNFILLTLYFIQEYQLELQNRNIEEFINIFVNGYLSVSILIKVF